MVWSEQRSPVLVHAHTEQTSIRTCIVFESQAAPLKSHTKSNQRHTNIWMPLKCNKQRKFHRNQLMSNPSENCSTLQQHLGCIIHSFDPKPRRTSSSLKGPWHELLAFQILAFQLLLAFFFFFWALFRDRFKLVLTQKHVPSVNRTAFLQHNHTHTCEVHTN